METAALFSTMARQDLPLVEYAREFCRLAVHTLDDATLSFWILNRDQLLSPRGPPRNHWTELEGRDPPVFGVCPTPIQNQPAVQRPWAVHQSSLSAIPQSSSSSAADSSPPVTEMSSPPAATTSSPPAVQFTPNRQRRMTRKRLLAALILAPVSSSPRAPQEQELILACKCFFWGAKGQGHRGCSAVAPRAPCAAMAPRAARFALEAFLVPVLHQPPGHLLLDSIKDY